jgi:hypothetical protein
MKTCESGDKAPPFLTSTLDAGQLLAWVALSPGNNSENKLLKKCMDSRHNMDATETRNSSLLQGIEPLPFSP